MLLIHTLYLHSIFFALLSVGPKLIGRDEMCLGLRGPGDGGGREIVVQVYNNKVYNTIIK